MCVGRRHLNAQGVCPEIYIRTFKIILYRILTYFNIFQPYFNLF